MKCVYISLKIYLLFPLNFIIGSIGLVVAVDFLHQTAGWAVLTSGENSSLHPEGRDISFYYLQTVVVHWDSFIHLPNRM